MPVKAPESLVLITIGNTLRSDDGVAEKCCENLPSASPFLVQPGELFTLLSQPSNTFRREISPGSKNITAEQVLHLPIESNHKERSCQIIKFDLGLKSSLLGPCLTGAEAAIVLDAMNSEQEIGSVQIIDLRELIERNASFSLRSSHGISIIDELRILQSISKLPGYIYFFGIEIENFGPGEALSPGLQLKMAAIQSKLCLFAETLLFPETVVTMQ